MSGRFPNIFGIVLAALLLVAGTGAALRARAVRVSGRTFWNLGDLARQWNLQGRFGQRRAEILGPGFRMNLEREKQWVVFNGVKVALNHQPEVRSGQWYADALDYQTALVPLWRINAPPPRPLRVIVLDPGHGGRDRGATGGGVQEKDLTLKLANKVRVLLRRAGYTVYQTRYTDMALPLATRDAYANAWKADLFLSLHFNSGPSSVQGLETFALTPAGGASTGNPRSESVIHPGNRFDANNLPLAWRIQRTLLRTTRAPDRGVKRARFAVLRDIRCPAVLIEGGFLSHPREAQKIATDAYLNLLAAGIAEGVLEYHRSMIHAPQRAR